MGPTALSQEARLTRILISNKLCLESLSVAVEGAILKALSIPNPTYVETATRMLWTLRRRGVAEAAQPAILDKMLRGIAPEICLATPTGKGLEVPRGCLPALAPLFKQGVWESPNPSNIDVTSEVELRGYQEQFIADLLESSFPFGIPGSGVGVAPPGSGKTVMGAEIIARLKTKTLWITHTSALAGQTAERFRSFLRGPSIEVIGGGKWKVGDITIALVQTLFRRDLTPLRDEFGLVIVDECHHVPARTFTDVVSAFNPLRMFGLSATPYRKDGLESLMFQALGPQLGRVEKATLVELGFLIPATILQVTTPCVLSDTIDDYADIVKGLHKNRKRTTFIAGDVVAEAKKGHECIVLVDMISYGEELRDVIRSSGLTCELVFSTKMAGGTKKKAIATMSSKARHEMIERFRSRETSVLVATYDLLSEGFDHPPLDRLFMTIPVSDKNRALLEQTLGRLERPSPGKVLALAYDYVDTHKLLLRQAEGRLVLYESNLMKVLKK